MPTDVRFWQGLMCKLYGGLSLRPWCRKENLTLNFTSDTVAGCDVEENILHAEIYKAFIKLYGGWSLRRCCEINPGANCPWSLRPLADLSNTCSLVDLNFILATCCHWQISQMLVTCLNLFVRGGKHFDFFQYLLLILWYKGCTVLSHYYYSQDNEEKIDNKQEDLW